jgi:uncharacterized protein YjiS (DUF1127 family)
MWPDRSIQSETPGMRRLALAVAPMPLLRALARALVTYRRQRQRYDLARLDDYMLRDIGLSRSEAHRESRKPFWRD